MQHSLSGQIVDIPGRRIFPGRLHIAEGKILRIEALPEAPMQFLIPGFVDAHVHIESSMLTPAEFARLAVLHGTVATVSDPHEIANVLGIEGVRYMQENGRRVPFKFFFGAPSCVPATSFETAGDEIGPDGIRELLQDPDILYLAEMMNYPGVVYGDAMVMEKIRIAHELGKPVDGHAPGLRGEALAHYIAAGISTDHECFTLDEALEKLALGMKILIREGSAAKNFEALAPLFEQYAGRLMFCSDDKHPDDLLPGHINQLAARAVAKGYNVFDVLTAACITPVMHYGLPVGQLREGDPADLAVVTDLQHFKVLQTWIGGQLVAENGESRIGRQPAGAPNRFNIGPLQPAAFRLPAGGEEIRVIEALDGELITRESIENACIREGLYEADPGRDLLKIAVVNRYREAPPAVAFIRNFGLKAGALASCVGHDSHNIIAVGADDDSLCRAVNLIVAHRGGIAAVAGEREKVLPLPVAGIMSDADGFEVARLYTEIDHMAHEMGSRLRAPFMTLSFMALLVIPDLKLSDLGLFAGSRFEFVPLSL